MSCCLNFAVLIRTRVPYGTVSELVTGTYLIYAHVPGFANVTRDPHVP